jgi:hypothetical protein
LKSRASSSASASRVENTEAVAGSHKVNSPSTQTKADLKEKPHTAAAKSSSTPAKSTDNSVLAAPPMNPLWNGKDYNKQVFRFSHSDPNHELLNCEKEVPLTSFCRDWANKTAERKLRPWFHYSGHKPPISIKTCCQIKIYSAACKSKFTVHLGLIVNAGRFQVKIFEKCGICEIHNMNKKKACGINLFEVAQQRKRSHMKRIK